MKLLLSIEPGTCNICSQNVVKEEKIDWKIRKEELKKLISKHKGKMNMTVLFHSVEARIVHGLYII